MVCHLYFVFLASLKYTIGSKSEFAAKYYSDKCCNTQAKLRISNCFPSLNPLVKQINFMNNWVHLFFFILQE